MHIRLILAHPLHPRQAITRKLFNLRLQLLTLDIEIIHRTDPRDQHPGVARAHSVHKGAAVGAEEVAHGVAGGDGAGLCVLLEFVLAADVVGAGGGDDEVGGEGRRGDFVAVGAVADEGAD